MADYPYIETLNDGPRPGEYSKIWLDPDRSFIISNYDLAQLYKVMAGRFAGYSFNTHTWNGLTTIEHDGHEIIKGWYGTLASAEYVARQLVERGKTKGARAYACIGEYGTYKDERAPVADPDAEPEDCPVTAPEKPRPVTLDTWGI